jgi:hypothetical protein
MATDTLLLSKGTTWPLRLITFNVPGAVASIGEAVGLKLAVLVDGGIGVLVVSMLAPALVLLGSF